MRVCVALVLMASALAVSQPAAAKGKAAPLVLEPSTPWNVDYGQETCQLSRTFGKNDNRHALFFTQWGPDSAFLLAAAGPGFKQFRSEKTTLIWVSTGSEPNEAKPKKAKMNGFGPSLIYNGLDLEIGQIDDTQPSKSVRSIPELDVEFAAKSKFVAMKQRDHEIRFETGPLGKAFKVLNDCAASLITEWGLDLEQHRTRSQPPIWKNRNSVIRRVSAAFPRAALKRGEQGIMQMRVNIDSSGSVTQCSIEDTSTQQLDPKACSPMSLAVFEPALDQDGKPMPSFYRESIPYQVRGRGPVR